MTAPAPKRGRGRPALPPERRHTHRVEVLLTAAERDDADRCVELAGASDLSTLIRDLLARELRRLAKAR